MDDYTPMEFVVHVLERFFKGPRETDSHHTPRAPPRDRGNGIYTHEVAGTKVTQTVDFPRQYQHPLWRVLKRPSDNHMTIVLYYRRFA
jgi:ATP-dependent Clp protease adaptor protein ClpS